MPIKQLQTTAAGNEWIIVDDHDAVSLRHPVKFATSYNMAQLSQGSTYKIRYLTERWNWFNEKLFDGEMKLPVFNLAKAMETPKTLGFWRASDRVQQYAPKIFQLANEFQLLGTILHEQCHQYVSEVLQQHESNSHGPIWQGVCHKVGLHGIAKNTAPTEVMYNLRQQKVLEKVKDGKYTPFSVADLKTEKYAFLIHPKKMKPRLLRVLDKWYPNAKGFTSVLGFDETYISNPEKSTAFFYMQFMYKLTPLQIKENMPESFKDEAAMSKMVNRLMQIEIPKGAD